MKKHFRSVAAALGLTTICLPRVLEPLVRQSHDEAYHWSGRTSALFGPMGLKILVVWAVLTVLFLTAEKTGRWRSMVWVGLVVLLPWIVANYLTAWPGILPHGFAMPPIWVAALLWLAIVLAWRPRFQGRYEAVIDVVSTVLVFTALSAVFFLSEFTWFWWQARGLNTPRQMHHDQVSEPANRPRIIWFVLDELSYQQLYGDRYPGLQLPEFDALAQQAAVFTQVAATANSTQKALPSLLTGTMVVDTRSSADGLLSVRLEGDKTWNRFDGHNTVFQDALNDGYSTALAGWYNPYCRILPAVLDRCYWTDHFFDEDNPGSQGDFRSSVASIGMWVGNGSLHDLISRLLRLPNAAADSSQRHIEDYRELSASADRILLNTKAGFVFLHLPIPHPGGIYDRRTGELTTSSSSYIDNLALTDRYLGHVRAELERTGQWDTSTIIVMGDHGWRTSQYWKSQPGWTQEEERASFGGKFDKRPAYIVKLAGETTGVSIDTPFDAVRTRALIDALMSGKIRTTEDLVSWAGSGGPRNENYARNAHR